MELIMEFIFVSLGFAIVTALAANARGKNPGGWFLLGLLFPLFAFIAVLVMPSMNVAAAGTQARSHTSFDALPKRTASAPPPATAAPSEKYAALEKIAELRDKGLLTNEEFETEKKSILSSVISSTEHRAHPPANADNVSEEAVFQALRERGYKATKTGPKAWKIIEPLGGIKKCISQDQFLDYAKGVMARNP